MTYTKKINLKKERENLILRNGQVAEYKINSNEFDIAGKHRIFFNCEDSSCATLKNESGAELLYMLIDDSLNFEKAEKNRYCLDLSCEKTLPYAKRILKKVMWQPLTYGLYAYNRFTPYIESWSVGVSVKAENLKIEDEGYLHLRADVWYVKEGVSPHDTISAPDETYVMEVSEGTYPYTVISRELTLKEEKTACVIVTVEGEKYSGNVYFESPFLSDCDGRNMLPEFEKANIGLERFGWLGQNLAKKEWPRFEISVNGKTVFDDEVFLKIHRFSPVEVELPVGCFEDGENTVSMKYKAEYIDPVPMLIDEVLLLEKENEDFSLIRCPDEFVSGKSVKLLLETSSADVEPDFESDDFSIEEVTKFEEFNLIVYSLKPLKEKNNIKFSFEYKGLKKDYVISRCIKKENDNVISGSGDMIYVNVDDVKAVCDYIKWYVANDIGDFVTIRQVYRWGGQRFVNPKVWELFTNLCEKLGLLYVHISDGRDIPGVATNPTEKMLEGENFMGRQLHERDGQLFYWGVNPREIQAPLEEFFDLAARLGREYPETVEGSYRPFNISYGEYGYSYRRDKVKNADMEEAHNLVANALKNLSGNNFTRHTGPSVMFKYFYQNGFKWTGMETMDGATEIPLAFMRGASNAYGIDKTGVHLALQWGNYPHDTEQRYRRYLLSLYIPYMHGVTDLNTEEGLWFIESMYDYFNRVSDVCERHRQQARKFNKFKRTHSRTGEFYTPIAFLHGRYDGWNGFGSPNTWGMPDIQNGEEADSWKLLKSFYPLNAINTNGCGKFMCVPEGNDKPIGLFSGTPMGNVDVVPVEHGDLSKYSVLVFAGYNKAEKADLDRVYDYVNNGGTLVCAWPHFSDTTAKKDIDEYNFSFIEHKIVSLLCKDKPEFADDNNIKICTNVADCEVLKTSEKGNPLVCNIPCGNGKIVLVNTLYYPGNEAVYDIYKNTVEEISADILSKEPVRVECGVDVEYTIFKQNDGARHYYFTAVDWYNDSEEKRNAKIIFNGNPYNIKMNFGELVKVVTDGKTAVYPECDCCEVIELNESAFTVQGYGKQNFYILRSGVTETVTVDFERNVMRIEL